MIGGRRRAMVALLVGLVVVPLLVAAGGQSEMARHWSETRWDSSGGLPPAATTPEAIVRVYAARTWGWKGVVAVHSWLVVKPEGATSYDRYEVVGWGVRAGREAIRRNLRPADGYWAGNPPELIAELRGPAAQAAIPRIERAIEAYPYRDVYRTWPGPNSNSFVAAVLREVPELGAALPPTAIGKDYLPNGAPFARAPSGTGIQLSLLGLLGLTLAVEEGLELNLLGLVIGLDPKRLGIKLPGIGRIGLLAPRTA
jgi:hypothetical protein